VARRSLAAGVATGRALDVDPRDFSDALAEIGASFVTIRIDAELRGCIGTIEASEPLVVDVARNAFKAGFRDPRFPPIDARDLDRIDLQISVLSPLEPLGLTTAAELVTRLAPGRDGVLIRQGDRSGTFLPAVWREIPDPVRFLRHLEHKAGIRETKRPAEFYAWRYSAETIGGAEPQ